MKKSVVMVLLSVFLFGKTVELEPINVTATPQKKEDVWIDVSCQDNWFTKKLNCAKVLSENPHGLTFEKAKCKYMMDKDMGLRGISGEWFYYNAIFELPQEKQCHYFEVWTQNSWEEAGDIINKESAIVNEGIRRLKGEKPDKTYSPYIRSKEEIDEILRTGKRPKIKSQCFSGVGSECVDEGFRKNDAVKYYAKGCSLGDGQSCSYLAAAYLGGYDVKQDKERAWRLWQKACKLGDGSACLQMGIRYFRAKQMKEAAKYLKEGCAKCDKFACIWVKEYGFR